MKAFLASVLVAVGVAFGAHYILTGNFQISAPDAFTTEGVRLTSPGDNLVQF